MAKIPDDLMDRLAGKKSKSITEVEHTSNNGRTEVERDFKKYKATDMKNYGIRLYPEDRRKLEEYFKKRDMTFSQGVRMVIKDFMERQGI